MNSLIGIMKAGSLGLLPLLLQIPLLSVFSNSLPVYAENITSHPYDRKEYYKRYEHYPEYCTTPSQQQNRQIPPLEEGNSVLLNTDDVELTMKHVTAIIRHGARTPTDDHDCWDGYNTADTSTWDCDLRTITNPPAPPAITFEHLVDEFSDPSSDTSYDATAYSGEGAHFGFEKIYDGLYSSKKNWNPPNIRNKLGQGTCQAGQLLLRGYDQEIMNGMFLRDAYVRDEANGVNTGKNEKHMLFDFDEGKDGKIEIGKRAYDEPVLYFRSDDDQRTIMSGQVVLRGLFGDLMARHVQKEGFLGSYTGIGWGGDKQPMVRVHTADREQDFLSPNHKICPKLDELEYNAESSSGYRGQFISSDEAEYMKDLKIDGLSGDTENQDRMLEPAKCIDCLMTTICTDRELPPLLHDYKMKNPHESKIVDIYGENLFERMMKFSTRQTSYKYTYDGAAYSKLAMTPLWSDILAHLLVHTPANKTILEKEWPGENKRYGNKLALYSGHDSTLMALLADLDAGSKLFWTGDDWPPYGSMFLIELYEADFSPEFKETKEGEWYDTGVVFRLIYNGKVMTQRLEGCRDELCDIAILILHLYGESSITDWDSKCEQSDWFKKLLSSESEKPKSQKPRHHLSTFGRNLAVFSALLMSAMIGALITYSVMMKKMLTSTMEERSVLEMSMESGNGASSGNDVSESDVSDSRIYGLNVNRAVVT